MKEKNMYIIRENITCYIWQYPKMHIYQKEMVQSVDTDANCSIACLQMPLYNILDWITKYKS